MEIKTSFGEDTPPETFTTTHRNCLDDNKINIRAGLGSTPVTFEKRYRYTPQKTVNNKKQKELQTTGLQQWFVMRDLKRSNAKQPAYLMLKEMHIEVFTPMKRQKTVRQGREVCKEMPFIQDLLFVHEVYEKLTPITIKHPTLQYRYLRHGYCRPMTVKDGDMERFIHAVSNADSLKYYLPEQITSAMHGRRIRIIGGPLDGYEGSLLTTRGSKVKRLLVELPNLLSVGVEVNPEYIQLIK